jgi:hypothetical protein
MSACADGFVQAHITSVHSRVRSPGVFAWHHSLPIPARSLPVPTLPQGFWGRVGEPCEPGWGRSRGLPQCTRVASCVPRVGAVRASASLARGGRSCRPPPQNPTSTPTLGSTGNMLIPLRVGGLWS